MRCSKCKHKRESDDFAPEWQCAHCKHINELAAQTIDNNIATHHLDTIPNNSYQLNTSEKYKNKANIDHFAFLEKIATTGWVFACLASAGFLAMYVTNNILAFFLIFVYLLPTLCAKCRRHQSILSIFILNLFLGWTLLGWVVSLVWALKTEDRVILTSPSNLPYYEELEKLACLRDKNIITEEEFQRKKNNLLNSRW